MRSRFVALLLLASAVTTALGASPHGLRSVPIDELKKVYLSCSRAALGGRLATGGIQQCSIVYEELKRRAFGGDFGKLLAWSRAQAAARRAGQ